MTQVVDKFLHESYGSLKANSMAVDDLVTRGVRASVAMRLIYLRPTYSTCSAQRVKLSRARSYMCFARRQQLIIQTVISR